MEAITSFVELVNFLNSGDNVERLGRNALPKCARRPSAESLGVRVGAGL